MRIHPLFWIIIAAGVATGRFKEVLMILAVVFVHEMGHAVAANYFGWQIKKIELLPFGGAAEIEAKGLRTIMEEVIIVLAGPVQHAWMMALSFILVGQSFWSYTDHQLFISHNVAILLFNLLPIYPLDGGRLLQLLWLSLYPYKKALRITLITSFTCLLLGLIGLCFFPFHLNIIVILLFLLTANYLELKQRNYRFMRFLMAKQHDDLVRTTKVIELKQNTLVRDAVEQLTRNRRHTFKLKEKPEAVLIDEKTVLDAYFHGRLHTSIQTIFTTPL